MPAGKSIKTCLALSVNFSPIIVHVEPVTVNTSDRRRYIHPWVNLKKRTGNETCEPKEVGATKGERRVKERI